MAAGALSQLALKSATIRVQVTQELVGLLGRTAAVRGRAAEALRDMNAEAGADARMSIAMAGGIDRFVHLLKDGSVEAQEYAIWFWQATDVQSKVSIAEADCAMPIINCLSLVNCTKSPMSTLPPSSVASSLSLKCRRTFHQKYARYRRPWRHPATDIVASQG